MNTPYSIQLSPTTYQWLTKKANDSETTPDQVADFLLRKTLAPKHAYVEVIARAGGDQAVIKGTRIAISMIIGYLNLGETPESLVTEVMPHLNLAQIYDAISYYHNHKEEIDEELAKNNDVGYWREYLQDALGEKGYKKIIGAK